jgi:serine protease Do
MEEYGKQEPETPNEGLKKMSTSLVCGLLFGLAAGLVMVVMVAVFVPARVGQNTSQTLETADNTDDTGSDEGVSAINAMNEDGDIQTVETTEQAQTVVTDVTEVVDRVMPSVVSIFSTYVIEGDFWGYSYDYEAEGGGSGIIVGENGEELLIATNNHVVEDSRELTVQFIDDSVAMASIKGTDEDMDLAVIAVDISDLDASTRETIRIATLGNSDTLKVGEPAIAIGNALGYGQSVTTGVISAVNRSYIDEEGPLYGGTANTDVENLENVKYLIQTDAAINPGNSGGALLNVRGEVIGINSNKIISYTTEGMGYAIPISTAEPIIEQLMTQKTKPRQVGKSGDLGISGVAVPDEMAERHQVSKGIYITKVFANSAAKEAGIKKGDILLSVEGETVGNMKELSEVLSCYEEGTEVTVQILKRSTSGYRQEELLVTLGGKE